MLFDVGTGLRFNSVMAEPSASEMDTVAQELAPLPYQVGVRDYVKTRERELWNWFASAQAQADYTEHLRLSLLKTTYRLDPAGHPELYRGVEEAKARLGLEIPVTAYQAQESPQSNAMLCFIRGEGHLLFSGQALALLNADELKSVIGHELAHYKLWSHDEGEFHITDRLLQAVAADPRAAASHEETARRYQLYTEIFADRGSLLVTGDLHRVIAGLVKMQTGLAQVSAAGYLQQAEEIFAHGNVATEEVSHPEAFIRARALALWQEQKEKAEEAIGAMIEGSAALDALDLPGQERLTKTTRRLLEHFLRPKWFQTAAVVGHAKLFFDDFQPAAGTADRLPDDLRLSDSKLREYVCYLLLDFVAVDPELDEVPLAAALQFSERLELNGQFEKLAAKELKLKARDLKRIKEQAAEMLAKAEANGE